MERPAKQLTETDCLGCGLPSRGLATLGVLLRGDDGGWPSDPLGVGTGLEDPRMFWSSSRLWMGWSSSSWSPTDLHFVIGRRASWRKLGLFFICGWSTLGSPTAKLGRRVFLRTGCRQQGRSILTRPLRRFGAETYQYLCCNFPKE
jgi:hypothetical protein